MLDSFQIVRDFPMTYRQDWIVCNSKKSKMKFGKVVTLLAAMSLCVSAFGQKAAIKTNILYDATATVNLGVEIGLAPRWTLDISGNYNGWTMPKNMKWKHWLVQPEARWWFCERFAGHFIGIHALGGQCNVGGIRNSIKLPGSDFSVLSDRRYQGWFAGLGAAYGHSWILGRHWNFEAELGLGWIYARYDVFPCAVCGTKLASDRAHNYFGPTKAAISLVYLF